MRIQYTASLLIGALTTAITWAAEIPQAVPAKKPNIIVILTDDQGYADASCYGGEKDIQTPNIDRIAKSGVRLTDGYASHCVCAPTRAGLLSGRYQQRFGVYGNKDIFDDGFLKQITIADRLKTFGYVTGAIGKWHLGRLTKDRWPSQRGFDEFYGFLKGGRNYFGQNPKNLIYRNDEPVDADDGYLTDSFSREAVAFIDRHSNKTPFFLYLAYNAPHYPLEAREKYLKQFNTGDPKRDLYLAMMASVDEGVGMILDALKTNGVDKDTLLFFLSDNGGTSGFGGKNTPLQGEKGSFWEGGIRVPFLVSWPDHLPAGKTCSVPVMSFDIFPTSIAAAGGSMPDDRIYDGRNILPVLEAPENPASKRPLFWANENDKWAVRDGNWKLIRTKPGKNTSEFSLYNLETDLGESNNLITAQPQVAERLNALYSEWRKEMK